MNIDEAIEYLEDQDISVDEVTAKWHVHSNEDHYNDQLIDCHFWSDEQLIKYVEELKEAEGDTDDEEVED